MKKRNFLWGILVGSINGFFSSGGGVIAVMVLEKALGLDEKKSHATSIMIILPLTLCGIIVYSLSGHTDLSLAIKTGAGSSLGALLGAVLLTKLSPGYIRILFGVIMLLGAIRMFFRG